MAEPDLQPNESGESLTRRRNMMMGGVFLGVMLLEGLAVFLAVRHFAPGPQQASGMTSGGLDASEGEPKPQWVEVEIVGFRAQNRKSQRMQVYDLSVFATVRETERKAFEKSVGINKMRLQDRLSAVVRAADPESFMEPGLDTLRDQFKEILDEVMGEEYEIQQVLIPSIVSYTDS